MTSYPVILTYILHSHSTWLSIVSFKRLIRVDRRILLDGTSLEDATSNDLDISLARPDKTPLALSVIRLVCT